MNQRIFVVGGAALDISGVPQDVCRLRDSNLGTVRLSVGGVGKNIATHLVPYGPEVQLITAIGSDFRADMIEKDCADCGIRLDHALHLDQPSATFVCVLDEEFSLLAGISDMGIMENLSPAFLEHLLPKLNAGSLCVLDANLPPESLDFLTESLTVPIYYEPVSCAKARRIGDNIGRCFAVKPNRFEAAHLSGRSCDTVRGAHRAADWFLEQGVQQVYISLGSDGVVWATPDACGHIEAEPYEVVDVTGAGYVMSAAIIDGILSGKPAEACAMAGNHKAGLHCARMEEA